MLVRSRPISHGAGVLTGGAENDPVAQALIAAFRQGLQQLGWTDGSNVRIDTRWAAGNVANMRKYAAELGTLAPDVILAVGSTNVEPLLQVTRTVPIVFTLVADPVGSGYINSLSRPGVNITGFMQFEYSLCGKWLELLKEIAPGVTRAAVLRDLHRYLRDRSARRYSVRGTVGRRGRFSDQHVDAGPSSSARSPPSRTPVTAV